MRYSRHHHLVLPIAGKDATAAFFGLHRQEVLLNPRFAKLRIGQIEGQKEKIHKPVSGELSRVPYAEPMWLSSDYKRSPYFKDSHYRVAREMRKFIDDVVYPDAQACEQSGKRMGQHVMDAMSELNLHAMRQGPGPHLKGRKLFNGAVEPEEFDYFHEMIINQELSRMSARGYADGFQSGTVIGLPPIINFAKPHLKNKIMEDAFAGKAVSLFSCGGGIPCVPLD